MKGIIKTLLIVGALGVSSLTQADDFSPFLGVDFAQTFMRAKNSWDLIFPKTYPGLSLYVGTRFHENFGIELGYDWSARRSKSWTLPNGSNFFGGTVTTAPALTGVTNIRRTGGHVDLWGFLPVAECTELMASIGYGWVQTKITSSFNIPVGNSNLSSIISSVSGQGRGVFRLGAGALYMITEMVGVRAKISWQSTSTLRVRGNAGFTTIGCVPGAFKGTTALSVGVLLRF